VGSTCCAGLRGVCRTIEDRRQSQRDLLLDHLQNQGTPPQASERPVNLLPIQMRDYLLSLLTALAAIADIIANIIKEITTWTR